MPTERDPRVAIMNAVKVMLELALRALQDIDSYAHTPPASSSSSDTAHSDTSSPPSLPSLPVPPMPRATPPHDPRARPPTSH